MAKKTQEEQEIEQLIRGQAIQAQQWQTQITQDEDLEQWIIAGNWKFLKEKVLDQLQREAFNTIKNPNFDPANFSQVAQFKALCQTIDLIEARIDQRLAMVQDARVQLKKLEIDSTQNKEGE